MSRQKEYIIDTNSEYCTNIVQKLGASFAVQLAGPYDEANCFEEEIFPITYTKCVSQCVDASGKTLVQGVQGEFTWSSFSYFLD